MALIGIVLAYWYYLEKFRKKESSEEDQQDAAVKYNLPVSKIKAYPIDEKFQSSDHTEPTVPGELRTEKTQKSATDTSKSANRKGKERANCRKSNSNEVLTAKSIAIIDPELASKYTFLRNKDPVMESFSEPIPEEELELYSSSKAVNPAEATTSLKKHLNEALTSFFNTSVNSLRKESINEEEVGKENGEVSKEPKLNKKSSGITGRKKKNSLTKFFNRKRRRKFATQSDDLITPSQCTVNFTLIF
ncbi:hypothetical protein RB195_020094 [Necator americanus]|uniref:Uncharacterized protein n=1 Tax=Necator americanus TaxID=51031 RepID=A0ABR1CH69_NECAM